MRRAIIAGNWKMHKTGPEAVQLAKELLNRVSEVSNTEVVICPPFTALESVAWVLGDGPVKIGGQNMHWAQEGAYTGEVAAKMLLTIGCRYVILGHSERRAQFGESNSIVNKKLKAALAGSLIPIICVGESLEEREKGQTEAVVQGHVQGAFEGLAPADLGPMRRSPPSSIQPTEPPPAPMVTTLSMGRARRRRSISPTVVTKGSRSFMRAASKLVPPMSMVMQSLYPWASA